MSQQTPTLPPLPPDVQAAIQQSTRKAVINFYREHIVKEPGYDPPEYRFYGAPNEIQREIANRITQELAPVLARQQEALQTIASKEPRMEWSGPYNSYGTECPRCEEMIGIAQQALQAARQAAGAGEEEEGRNIPHQGDCPIRLRRHE